SWGSGAFSLWQANRQLLGAHSVRRIQDKGQRRDGANPTMRISRCTSGRCSASCSIATLSSARGCVVTPIVPLHGQQNSKSALVFRKTTELLQVFVSHCPPSVLPEVRMALARIIREGSS